MGVEAGPDGGPTDRQVVEAVDRLLDPRQVRVELGDVAGELLAEGERDRVLQVGAPDLHDVGELGRPPVERVAQRRGPTGRAGAVTSSTAAMFIAVGNVSLDDCDMFT